MWLACLMHDLLLRLEHSDQLEDKIVFWSQWKYMNWSRICCQMKNTCQFLKKSPKNTFSQHWSYWKSNKNYSNLRYVSCLCFLLRDWAFFREIACLTAEDKLANKQYTCFIQCVKSYTTFDKGTNCMPSVVPYGKCKWVRKYISYSPLFVFVFPHLSLVKMLRASVLWDSKATVRCVQGKGTFIRICILHSKRLALIRWHHWDVCPLLVVSGMSAALHSRSKNRKFIRHLNSSN